MSKKNIKRITNLILTILILIISIYFVNNDSKNNRESVIFYSCVDGDTAKFTTSIGVETTRFLAIDTPETVDPNKKVEPYGIESSDYTCNSLKKAKRIVLEYDFNSNKYDKYKRLLAWIWVDDVLLQDSLVRIGYAKVAYLYGEYKYTSILKNSEVIAKNNRIGIWYNK